MIIITQNYNQEFPSFINVVNPVIIASDIFHVRTLFRITAVLSYWSPNTVMSTNRQYLFRKISHTLGLGLHVLNYTRPAFLKACGKHFCYKDKLSQKLIFRNYKDKCGWPSLVSIKITLFEGKIREAEILFSKSQISCIHKLIEARGRLLEEQKSSG